MFNRGTPHGERGLIPLGGHLLPSSIAGDNLLWKKAQKNAKKKHTSDTINKTSPIRNPRAVVSVWKPTIVPSRITSRHHWNIVIIINTNPRLNKVIPCPWNHEAVPLVKNKAPKDPVKGHGLYSTKWNGLTIHVQLSFKLFIKNFYTTLKLKRTYLTTIATVRNLFHVKDIKVS